MLRGLWERSTKFLIDYLLTLSGIAATTIGLLTIGREDKTGAFQAAIYTLAVYQIVLLFVVWAAIREVRNLSKRIEQNNTFIDGVLYSDKTFRQLADERSNLDQRSFSIYLNDGTAKRDDLYEALCQYLSFLCRATEQILSNRKGIGQNQCAANIKLLIRSERGPVYVTVAYSDNYDNERAEAQEARRKRGTRYRLQDNSCFHEILNNRSRDRFISNDMNRYILDKSSDSHPEPNNDALRYYNKCLIIPISAYKNRVNNYIAKRFEFISDPDFHVEDGIVGFISVDSKSEKFTFDDKFDINIVKEMSIHAHSAYHQYNLMLMANEMKVLSEKEKCA